MATANPNVYELLEDLRYTQDADLLKTATAKQLRWLHAEMSAKWRELIATELASRGESLAAPREAAEWKSRPGTTARFEEEDEAIHGVN